ncbi:MAG TPA: hypothetical protein PKC72_02895 [Chitinophagaceae bacterium]|nr:hypothetical protein [Chitinophagaceae bacterium]
MKNDAQPSLFSLVSSLKLVKEEFPAKTQERSPYLRAVLSGNSKTQNENNNECTDRDAALRYIRESKLLHKK